MPGGRYSRPWFKIYDDARTDEKLATLTDAQHRVWFGLMCLANSDPERGSISGARASQPALLALAAARGDEALLAATLARLVALNIVEVLHHPGTGAVLAYTFVHWAERQDQTPSARPAAVRARVRRYRQRQRSPDTPDDNSLHSLPGAPDVTPVTRVTDVTRYTSLHPSGRSDANSLHSLQWSPNVTTAAGVVTDVTRYTSLHARGASGANSLHSLPPEAAARNECNDLDESTALIADVTTDERREDRDTTTVITDQNDQPNSHTRARLDKLDLDHPRASARQVKSGAAGERAAPAQMRVSAAKLAWWNAYLDEQAQDIPVPAEWRTLPWMQRVLARFLAVARSRGTRHADWEIGRAHV